MSLLLIWLYRRSVRLAPWLLGLLLVIDVLALNTVIAIYGAASNPFNAVLLIPVVLAFTLLPLLYAGIVLLISAAAQSIQLLLLPLHYRGSGMEEHYYSMVISFVITSGLVALVISYFRYQLTQREQAIRQLRERQLRDEQLLAIGTAAAQLAHEVATPAQSLRLLLEEAQEQQPSPAWLQPIVEQFSRIEEHLRSWRRIADDVREQRMSVYFAGDICQTLLNIISLNRPEVNVVWEQQYMKSEAKVYADATLVPALSSIVMNGCDAANDESTLVLVTIATSPGEFNLTIKNNKRAMDEEQLARLGTRVSASEKGFGVGAVVSNATIEKFGGSVTWQLQDEQIVTRVTLPLTEPDE
ncbi:MAG: ATP-binding protein [Pseudomonadota bacterium]